MSKIELEDGKYTYINDDQGQRALRYGEPWRDLAGDKFVYCLAAEIEALRAEIEALKQQVEQGKRDAERYLATLVISNEAIRQFRNEDMLARLIKLRGTQGYCQLVSAFDIGRDVIEAAIAAAPKQEK